MNRIAVIGSGGAGKSTLAAKLGSFLNIPVYHLDKYFWKPGWEKTDHQLWLDINFDLINRDQWIIDGNYRSTMSERLDAADTIIFMDFNRYTCLLNAFKRYFHYKGKVRPDITEGCYEKIDLEYVEWIWDYPSKLRPNTIQKISKYGKGKNIYILRNSKEVENFINSLIESTK